MSLDVYLSRAYCEACERRGEEPFWQNYTHNVSDMAEAAGLYMTVWRPDEVGLRLACDVAEPIRAGIARLKADPDKYRTMNPKNGWGSYDTFIPWLEKYLAACEEHPFAEVRTSI